MEEESGSATISRPLQQLSKDLLSSEAFLFDSLEATRWHGISRGVSRGHQLFIGKNPLSMSQVPPDNSPAEIVNTATINYYLKASLDESPSLKITSLDDERSFAVSLDNTPGILRFRWDMHFDPSEGQRKEFLEKLEDVFSRLKERVDKDRMQLLNELYKSSRVPKQLKN